MALIKWAPLHDMINDDFDPRHDWGWPFQQSDHFVPAIDVYEDDENVIVETPLSGIDPKKINIEIEDNILKLSGSTEKKSEVDEKNYYRKEVRTGQFFRSVALPKAVDSDKAKAGYKEGILKITVPKKEEAKTKSVNVDIED
ncbi:MAG: Hsp20/alpha crystallin family protein [bacterium]